MVVRLCADVSKGFSVVAELGMVSALVGYWLALRVMVSGLFEFIVRECA
jgi:hypothetical protein